MKRVKINLMGSLSQHLQKLLEQNRKALHELVEVTDVASADFVHVSDAMSMLNEQMHLIMQMQYEAREAAVVSASAGAEGNTSSPIGTTAHTLKSKRLRGGQKQYYILDPQARADFSSHIGQIFKHYYRKDKTFELPDGTIVNAPRFLALLYFLGIKLGLTTGDAPVNDFYLLVKEGVACLDGIDFYTAYATVQRETRTCRSYVSDTSRYDTTILLHTIVPSQVLPRHRNAYTRDITLLTQLEALWHI